MDTKTFQREFKMVYGRDTNPDIIADRYVSMLAQRIWGAARKDIRSEIIKEIAEKVKGL